MPRIAVLVPCHNEAATIGQVVTAFAAQLPTASIHVFDNNSSDATIERARAVGARVREVALQGKGNVVRRLFADVDADVYVLVDGDATYDAAMAPALVERLLRDGLDMVVGARRYVKSFPAHAAGFETEVDCSCACRAVARVDGACRRRRRRRMSAAIDASPRPNRRQRLLRALDRRFAFHDRGNVIAAGIAVALLGALLSLLLGQDANWDLRNYHLYNGYAALHGRLGIRIGGVQFPRIASLCRARAGDAG